MSPSPILGFASSSILHGYLLEYITESTSLNPYSTIQAVAMDGSGNTYVGGYFINSYNARNGFVAKFDKNGKIVWHRSLIDGQPVANQSTQVFAMAVTSNQQLAVTGSFASSSGPGTTYIFLHRYYSDGTLFFQRQIYGVAGTGNSSSGQGLALDSSDNIYITGYAQRTPGGGAYCWTAKYNSSGVLQWQRFLTDTTGSPNTQGYSIAVNDFYSAVYVSGQYNATTTPTTGWVPFIAKYNTSGVLQWQRYLTGAVAQTTDAAFGVGVDYQGNAYVTGKYKISPSAQGNNGFIAKYNASGTIQWQRVFYDSHALASVNTQGRAVADNGFTGVVVTGFHNGSSNFLTGCVLGYDYSGNIQYMRTLTSDAAQQSNFVNSIAINYSAPNNSAMVIGTQLVLASGPQYFGAVLRVPNNGGRTNSVTGFSGSTLTYANPGINNIISDSAGTLSEGAAAMTDSAGTATDQVGGYLVDSAITTTFTGAIAV